MSEPWSKFFWADWRSDPGLRACSYGARGLWMDLLALMHVAEPYGHLLINGQKPTEEEIAKATSGTAKDVKRYLPEIIKWGVTGINGDGVLYSRRMVRDKQRSIAGKAYGVKGGNPKLTDKGGGDGGLTTPDKPNRKEPLRPGDKGLTYARVSAHAPIASHIPEARSQKEETPPPSGAPPLGESELLDIPDFLRRTKPDVQSPTAGEEIDPITAENSPKQPDVEPRENHPPGGNGHDRNPRGSRLPPDWQPDDADRAAAAGLDLERTTADFRDYWHAKAGRDAVKVDWAATWRKWCRRAADDPGRSNGNGSKPASTLAAGRRALARITGGSAGDTGPDGERLFDDDPAASAN